MPQSHSRGCRVRWATATWAVTITILVAYIAWVGRSGILEDALIAVFNVATSIAAVWVLARYPYLAVVLLTTAAAGFVAAYAVGAVTYGTEGELQNGLTFRAVGGAIAGGVSAVAAWVLLRGAHPALSRGTCPSTD